MIEFITLTNMMLWTVSSRAQIQIKVLYEAVTTNSISLKYVTTGDTIHQHTVSSPLLAPGFPSIRLPDLKIVSRYIHVRLQLFTLVPNYSFAT